MSEFLKCDAPGCDHRETVENITDEMVGKACPKCGANLLTESDWKFYETVFRPMSQVMFDAGLTRPSEPGEPGALSFNWHEGELRIKAATPPKP